jgi:hypothetical protein
MRRAACPSTAADVPGRGAFCRAVRACRRGTAVAASPPNWCPHPPARIQGRRPPGSAGPSRRAGAHATELSKTISHGRGPINRDNAPARRHPTGRRCPASRWLAKRKFGCTGAAPSARLPGPAVANLLCIAPRAGVSSPWISPSPPCPARNQGRRPPGSAGPSPRAGASATERINTTSRGQGPIYRDTAPARRHPTGRRCPASRPPAEGHGR